MKLNVTEEKRQKKKFFIFAKIIRISITTTGMERNILRNILRKPVSCSGSLLGLADLKK